MNIKRSTFRHIATALMVSLLVSCTSDRGNTPKYEVNIEDTAGSKVCEIVFFEPLPPPEVADKIVRESLENVVKKDPSKDILATAFLGDETLNSNQYSGMLVYKASEKKIMTLNE